MLRMRYVHFETTTLQNVIQGRPVHAGNLHRYRLDSALLQPPCHSMEVRGETAEILHGLWVARAVRYSEVGEASPTIQSEAHQTLPRFKTFSGELSDP
jgi:hypothetical protein